MLRDIGAYEIKCVKFESVGKYLLPYVLSLPLAPDVVVQRDEDELDVGVVVRNQETQFLLYREYFYSILVNPFQPCFEPAVRALTKVLLADDDGTAAVGEEHL